MGRAKREEKDRLMPLFKELREANETVDRAEVERILARPAQPRLLTLGGVLRLAVWIAETQATRPEQPARYEELLAEARAFAADPTPARAVRLPVPAHRSADAWGGPTMLTLLETFEAFGGYPFLVMLGFGRLVAAVARERGAHRAAFAVALRDEAARREAEEVRDELGGKEPVTRVVWTAPSEVRKRSEAWLLRLEGDAWGSIVRDRVKRSRRLWFTGAHDDALSTIPDEHFAAAARAASEGDSTGRAGPRSRDR